MTVSGNEDKTGLISRQSSNCSAGVPIKKRKFPFVRTTSLPQEPSILHVEKDSSPKEQSKLTQDSSPSDGNIGTNFPSISNPSKNSFAKELKEGPADTNLNLNLVQKNVSFSRVTKNTSPSDARMETNYPRISDAIKSFFSKEIEGPADKIFNSVQNCVRFSRVKFEVPSLPIFSGSLDNMDGKKNVISEDTNLQLVPNEGLATNDGKGITIKHKIERACKLELLSAVVGNADLSLALKEHLILPLAGQNSEQTCQIPHEVDHPSVCLSLGKGEPIISNTVDGDGALLPSNRSNWDLNTTMDAWECSIDDATTAADQGALGFGGSSNGITGLHDAQSSAVSSTGIFGASADLGQPTVGAGDQRSSLPMSLSCARKQYKPDGLPTNFSGGTSSSVARIASSSVEPSLNFLAVLLPSGNPNAVGCRIVKLESHDENARHNVSEAWEDPMRSLGLKMSLSTPHKLIEQMPVKSEPAQDNQETQRKTKETSYQSGGRVAQDDNNGPSKFVMSLNSDYTTKDVKINSALPHERCNNFDQVASETDVTCLDHQSGGSNVADVIADILVAKDLVLNDSGSCWKNKRHGLKMTNDHPPDSDVSVEESGSDEERFNISTDMLDEDSFSSDLELDVDHAKVTLWDGGDRQFHPDDEEYEDGEFRELLLHTSSGGPIAEKREARNDNPGNSGMDLGSPCGGIITEFGNKEGKNLGDRCETSDEHIKECVGPVIIEKANQDVEKDGSLKTVHIKECGDSLTVEVAETGSVDRSCIINTPRKLLDQVGGTDLQKGNEMVLLSAGATTATTTVSQGSVTADGQAVGDKSRGTESLEKDDSTPPKTDASLNVEAAFKDGKTECNRSWIITLPRATNVSPCKTRSIQGKSFPSQSGRGRVFNFDRENPRGNRDEIYNDGPRKYSRERFEDRSFRNSRPNFIRGRGRFSGRLDTQRDNWDSDRDFPSENYSDSYDYRFSRHKRDPPDKELDRRGFIADTPNGAFISSGIGGGKKPLNDEFPLFRHPFSRRHSPDCREGPATRGNQMVRRIPQNISPSRRMGEDRSNMVGLRRGDKFMRGFSDDNGMDNPVFTLPQHSYYGVDSQFIRGNINFSSIQRRGSLPRIRSKSPIRSRTRSPGPWSSPRRRSPDGFNGLPELIHRRSSGNNYTRERMRSHISRPSNHLKDVKSGRDHGYPRFAMPNRRSSPDRVLPRSTRKFDNLDPRARTDDEYFGKFHHLGGDENGGERRESFDARGAVRNFRPPYHNGADTDNFHFHVENDPSGPFRVCSEHDPDFLEKNDSRELKFDGRIKGRSLNASGRTKINEEQEGNCRHGRQKWHDDGFDDVSRVKRRKF